MPSHSTPFAPIVHPKLNSGKESVAHAEFGMRSADVVSSLWLERIGAQRRHYTSRLRVRPAYFGVAAFGRKPPFEFSSRFAALCREAATPVFQFINYFPLPAGPAAAVPLNVSSAVITLTPEMEAETLAWTIRPNRPVMVASMVRVCPGRADPKILTPRNAVSFSRSFRASRNRHHLDFTLQPFAKAFLLDLQIVMRLQVQPELSGHLEVAAQP